MAGDFPSPIGWIIDWWVPVPVFHFADYDGVSEQRWRQAKIDAGFDPDQRPPEQGPWKETYSYCGRKLMDRGLMRDADPIPTKHVVRIGKPCRGCLAGWFRREEEHAD